MIEPEKITYRDTFAFAWRYWRQRPAMGAAAVALMIQAAALDVVLPIYSGKIVDALVTHEPGSEVGLRLALTYLGLFAAVMLGHFVTRWVAMEVFLRFAVQNMAAILRDALEAVQRFSSQWHADAFAGATVRKITRGMWAFDALEDTLMIGFLPMVCVLVGMSALMLVKLPVVGALLAVLVTVHIGLNLWMAVRIQRPLFTKSAEGDTAVGAFLADVVTSNPIVKAFGTEAREEARFNRMVARWGLRNRKAWSVGELCALVSACTRGTMMVAMTGATIWLWYGGQATPGDIAFVLFSSFILIAYTWNIGQNIRELQKAISEMEDVVAFALRAEPLRDAPDSAVFRPGAGEIALESVGFAYPGTGQSLFDELDLRIAPGEKVALVGHSGSGKSSLIKLIQRLYDVDAGRVLVDGQDVRGVTQASLRAGIALVPQESALFHRTIAANIAYGRPGATRGEIEAAARQAYAHDFIAGLPQGYDTLVGERGVKLSGGERQRVAIARAILADARILILDEATASLDSVSEHYIQRALANLMEGRTSITVAHRLSTIRAADRILVFDKGRIVEQGTHAALLAQGGSIYRELHETQMFFG